MKLNLIRVLLQIIYASSIASVYSAVTAPLGQPAPLAPATTSYVFNITVSQRAPDCFAKGVLVVNGEMNPPVQVVQGNTLEVVVYNNIPEDWPLMSEGITIHWHGFDMKGVQWYDGVGYLTQCPIPSGANFTYRFQVMEEPGTYFWHGHAGMEKVDSLFGPLIVLPPRGAPAIAQYDDERTLLLTDNYHGEATLLAAALNRPFDPDKITNTSGSFNWVGVPQSILLNGHGFYGDCALLDGGNFLVDPKCNVTRQWIPPGRSSVLPYNAPSNPGCSRYNMTVEAGKTYRIRMINAGSLVFYTVCFAGHNVTIIAADSFPVTPLSVSCVDINLGQRYDVLLEANQPAGNYWINVLATNTTRMGAPGGYGVLRYAGANETLPADPIMQPDNVPMWGLETFEAITLPAALLNASTIPQGTVLPVNETTLVPPNRTHILHVTFSTVLLPSGQIRWAMNNVATYGTPSCTPTLAQLQADPGFLAREALQSKQGNSTSVDNVQSGDAEKVSMYLDDGSPTPSYPVAGQEYMQLKLGDVVEVVLQNNAAWLNEDADYSDGGLGCNRTLREEHPFHMHGHHFWVLGHGIGVYNETANRTSLNVVNPPYRDSFTIFKNGWSVIRFKADNPGVWMMHCHVDWHMFMGQKMYFSVEPETAPQPPSDLPQCPFDCLYNFGPFTPDYVEDTWGDSGYAA